MKVFLMIVAFSYVFAILNMHVYKKNSDTSLTVISYNIRYDNPGDGMNAWPQRSDHVAEMMGVKYQADIIGVQEALKSQIVDLEERLPEYSWVGVGRDDGKEACEFSPIFYRSDRLELIVAHTFWLSETPHQPGSISWDAAITRIVTWAKFKDRSTHQEFYVINTHFDHRGNQARVESAKLIGSFIADLIKNIPVIVTGDFNATENSKTYSVMTNIPGIVDARYASETEHAGPTASFNNWKELRADESRIDYIFVRDNVRVLTHQILDDRYDGRFPSDHLPVLVDVLINTVD